MGPPGFEPALPLRQMSSKVDMSCQQGRRVTQELWSHLPVASSGVMSVAPSGSAPICYPRQNFPCMVCKLDHSRRPPTSDQREAGVLAKNVERRLLARRFGLSCLASDNGKLPWSYLCGKKTQGESRACDVIETWLDEWLDLTSGTRQPHAWLKKAGRYHGRIPSDGTRAAQQSSVQAFSSAHLPNRANCCWQSRPHDLHRCWGKKYPQSAVTARWSVLLRLHSELTWLCDTIVPVGQASCSLSDGAQSGR